MDKKIFISILISSNKPFLWKRLYDSLMKKNEIPVEIIFVGPNSPSFKLANNCKFIRTKVKPSQCWEIASREAKGKYFFISSDDLLFSKCFLNIVYKQIQRDKKYIYCISFKKRYKNKKIISDKITQKLKKKDENSPILGIISLFNSKEWRRIGGIDKRFISIQWDIDMQLRFFENGYNLFLIKDCYVIEILTKKKHLTRFAGKDKKTLKSFWIKEKKYYKNRLYPVESFSDKDILNFSQGEKELIGYKKWI